MRVMVVQAPLEQLVLLAPLEVTPPERRVREEVMAKQLTRLLAELLAEGMMTSSSWTPLVTLMLPRGQFLECWARSPRSGGSFRLASWARKLARSDLERC